MFSGQKTDRHDGQVGNSRDARMSALTPKADK